MEECKKEDRLCCRQSSNITPIDGTYTCVKCGLVNDVLYIPTTVPGYWANDNITRLKEPINEYCERGNIDLQTGYFAEKIFNEFSAKGKRLHKTPLASACLYVSCRKNGVPRTIKEISAISGCDIKQMGRYEKIVSNTYYPSDATLYVDRFCLKMGLSLLQTKIVRQEIQRNQDKIGSSNTVAMACAFIFKHLKKNICVNMLEDVSGVPVSTIKRMAKTIE